IEAWVSIPIGVVTLAERHGGHKVSRETYEAMISEVAVHVDRFVAEHGSPEIDRVHLLGTSGTVTTIAGVFLELRRYDRRRIDGCWLSDVEVTTVIERLLGWSYEDRVANACIGAERADLVLAGCAILDAMRRAFPCRRLRVADRGLREGMLVKMMREDGVWERGADGEGGRGASVNLKAGSRPARAARSPPSSGSSASSTILTSRVPSAKAIARVPPTS